ncbi:MAG: ribosome-associated translation inhibitor RaiA [Alloprevotella sp.]|nr:ribosome-associated translation inhibitor RaiA [Alloprevotella sp.]
MDIKIQSIHFNATDKLQEFIEKKLAKVAKGNDFIKTAEVTLKVVRPETANNKEVAISLAVPGSDVRAEKVCDTFEEGVDLCIDVLRRQLEKVKDKQRGR